ncbi:MAG: PKD domain-containing protein, partial [Myxococcaceae bacterium]
MGMGNAPPVVDSVTVSPSPAPASGSATISCAAHDTDGTVTTMTITVSGGTLPSSAATQAIVISAAASVTGSIVWTTPVAGDYTVTCDVKDSGDPFLGIPALGTLAVPVTVSVGAALPPVIDTLASFDSTLVAGASTRVVAAAHDPAGGPLTWAWSTSGGTLAASGDSATWTAPAVGGSFTVTLTVSNGSGQSATASLQLVVAPKKYSGGMGALASPRRISVAPNGRLAVVDASTGRLAVLTPRGDLMGMFELPEPAIAAAWCWGGLVASTEGGRLYKLDPQGRPQGEVVLKGGRAAWPSGLACDEVQGLLFVAEREGARVRAVWADGTTAFALTEAGAQPLAAPVDLAIDSASGLLWVLLESNQWAPALQVHAFTRGGVYTRSAVAFGGGNGQVTRGAGIAAGAGGKLFIADAFQGTVEAFEATGTALGTMGSFGPAPGQLLQPSGLALLSGGDLVVANTGAGRLDRFGTGAPLPGCAGDADCDGLPDVWERAYGFNPLDARDAFADVDGDGLTNAEELAYGTDPRRRDTDGDGYSDGEEIAQAFNPLDPLDHRPTLVAGAPGSSDPGLVRLDATLQGRGSCQVSWTQVAGPTVVLREATGATPSFVARQAATYQFQGTPVCQGSSGTPTTVEATVREVAPRAEPGRLVAVRTGESFLLDGAFTSDANGGLLSLQWDQSLGPPRLATTTAPQATVRAYGAGLYSFQLTALDDAGTTSTAEAPVLVVAPGRQAPTAMPESPVFGHTGQAVTLDASASVGPPGAALGFVWAQTAGPAVTLGAANPARPTFVP